MNTFEQTSIRAWMWFIIRGLCVFSAVILIWGAITIGISDNWVSSMINNITVFLGITWIDRLEKEITQRNRAAKAALTAAVSPDVTPWQDTEKDKDERQD